MNDTSPGNIVYLLCARIIRLKLAWFHYTMWYVTFCDMPRGLHSVFDLLSQLVSAHLSISSVYFCAHTSR